MRPLTARFAGRVVLLAVLPLGIGIRIGMPVHSGSDSSIAVGMHTQNGGEKLWLTACLLLLRVRKTRAQDPSVFPSRDLDVRPCISDCLALFVGMPISWPRYSWCRCRMRDRQCTRPRWNASCVGEGAPGGRKAPKRQTERNNLHQPACFSLVSVYSRQGDRRLLPCQYS